MSRHRCPPWCHQCPDMLAAVRSARPDDPFDPVWDQFMPGCMGGATFGPGGCHCYPTGQRLTASQATELRRQLAEYDHAARKKNPTVKGRPVLKVVRAS